MDRKHMTVEIIGYTHCSMKTARLNKKKYNRAHKSNVFLRA